MLQRHASLAFSGSLLALLVVPMASLAAQRQGRISGKVTNSAGELLADAKVTITTKASSSFRKVLTTGKDGTYAAFLNDATVSYHYRFEKPGFVAVERDKKVPIWNPDAVPGVYKSSEEMSVLDVRLVAEPQAEKTVK